MLNEGRVLVGANSHNIVKLKEDTVPFPRICTIYLALESSRYSSLFPTELMFVIYVEQLMEELSKKEVLWVFQEIYDVICSEDAYEEDDSEMWVTLSTEKFAEILYKNFAYLKQLEEEA